MYHFHYIAHAAVRHYVPLNLKKTLYVAQREFTRVDFSFDLFLANSQKFFDIPLHYYHLITQHMDVRTQHFAS